MLGFKSWGWDLSLEAGIWASGLGFEPQGWENKIELNELIELEYRIALLINMFSCICMLKQTSIQFFIDPTLNHKKSRKKINLNFP